jgi:hypothetical protein
MEIPWAKVIFTRTFHGRGYIYYMKICGNSMGVPK